MGNSIKLSTNADIEAERKRIIAAARAGKNTPDAPRPIPVSKFANRGEEATRARESVQVAQHNHRAVKAGNVADLTLDQWLATLAYFEWKCAYCHKQPYEVLEHFVSLSLGGGTTVKNCVPACDLCNNRKKRNAGISTLHPSLLTSRLEQFLHIHEEVS